MKNKTDPMMTAHVFGKNGCAKCAALNKRLDAILKEEPYSSMFQKTYHDVSSSEEALVEFCKAQCINPNRIPALIISDCMGYMEHECECDMERSKTQGRSRLFQYIGIQTDYSDEGKGIITAEMIRKVLDEAIESSQNME